MEIKTKLDVNQTCYFMKDNKIIKDSVKIIAVNIDEGINVERNYYMRDSDIWQESHEVFISKENLIKSLLED